MVYFKIILWGIVKRTDLYQHKGRTGIGGNIVFSLEPTLIKIEWQLANVSAKVGGTGTLEALGCYVLAKELHQYPVLLKVRKWMQYFVLISSHSFLSFLLNTTSIDCKVKTFLTFSNKQNFFNSESVG